MSDTHKTFMAAMNRVAAEYKRGIEEGVTAIGNAVRTPTHTPPRIEPGDDSASSW